MKKALKIRIWLLVLLVCAACSAGQALDPALVPTAEYLEQNPLPTPEFVLRYSKIAEGCPCYAIKKAASVEITARPFSHVGTSADELVDYLIKNGFVEVDGRRVTTETLNGLMLVCEGFDPAKPTSDQKCWVGPLEIYFDVGDFSPGLHMAKVTINDLDGVSHSYMWSFHIPVDLTATPSPSP